MIRKILGATTLIVALLFAGCGGSAHTFTSSHVAKQDTVKAEAIFNKCVPNPFTLISKNGRAQAVACLKHTVPPQRRAAFERCVSKGVLTGGIPSKRRIENAVQTCIVRYV